MSRAKNWIQWRQCERIQATVNTLSVLARLQRTYLTFLLQHSIAVQHLVLFHLASIPDDVWLDASAYYYNNRHEAQREDWDVLGEAAYVNWWESPTAVILMPTRLKAKWQSMMDELTTFRTDVESAGLPVLVVVGGGTPTFPFHAKHTAHECSPGTTLLWDFGYAENFADLEYQQAAVILSRVVSKPGSDRITLDLGHKGIAAENSHPRVKFIGLEDAEAVVHSEEHLTLQTPRATEFRVGDLLYGSPRHICPTVALYDRAHVIRQGKLIAQWQITARARKLTY